MNVLYVKFVFGIKGANTPKVHTFLGPVVLLPLSLNATIAFLMAVITKNQNIKTNALATEDENTDKIKTPTIMMIGAKNVIKSNAVDNADLPSVSETNISNGFTSAAPPPPIDVDDEELVIGPPPPDAILLY
jgi:hypothetical protein